MTTIYPTHSGAPNQCHLRSIGRRSSISDVPEIIHFYKTVTLLGRNKDVVDYSMSCPVSGGKDCMSRIHARVIRTTNTYRLVDSSLTGVYVNDVRVNGTVNLQEGDTVTFGHPMRKDIRPGTQVRQPNSEFYFLFERCNCRMDQQQNAHEEKRSPLPQINLPLLTSPEGPQVYNSSLVFEKNVGLPIIPQLVVSNSTALSKSSKHCNVVQSPTDTVTLPLSSAASVLSSVKSSLCTASVTMTSDKLEMPAACRSTATPHTSLEDCSRPLSQIVRSASPEYVHWKGSAVSVGSCQQSAFETAQLSLFQENSRTAELANSDLFCVSPSGDQACTSGSMPKLYRPFLGEKRDSGEMETQPPAVTCHSQETSVPFLHSRDVVETHDSDPNGRASFKAHLSDNSLDISDPFRVVCGGNLDSKPLAPVADKSVPGNCANSDYEEMMEISVINSPEETAKHATPGSSEPSSQIQVTEVINEAMKNVQVPSVSDYKENLMDKERSTEEQKEHSVEQHGGGCVHETPCVDVSVTEAETFVSHSRERDCLHVNSLSESVIVEVENCSENSNCITINSIPENIASSTSPDSPSHKMAKELGMLFETMTVNGNLELSIPFGPGLEVPHSGHSEIKNKICKDELASLIKQNHLMPNEAAVKESSDSVEWDNSVVDRDLETLKNTSAVETQEPAAALDFQETDEPRNDKIMMISKREVGAIPRDHVFEHKLQNTLDQNYMSSDTGMINLEYQNSSNAHKILTVCATKDVSSSECDVGSAKSQGNKDNSNGVALSQRCTEQVISRTSGSEIIQCLDMPPSEEGESSVHSHVAIDGLVSKILQDSAVPSASENPPLCAQYISDYHVCSPSKDRIVSKDTYLEDVTFDYVHSSGSLHSESSSQQPTRKAEETYNSDVVVKPLSGTCCSLQARTVEMTSPECPCRYEDSGAFTSVSETVNQENNIQPLTPNETEASFKQNLCNKANISHAVCLGATVCTESEDFQSDHVSVTSSVSTKGVLQRVSSDFGVNKIHLEVNASEGHDEQPDRNVNVVSSTKDSPVRHREKDESESKMDSMDAETRISSVIDYVDVSGAEEEIQTRLINEREINVLAKKPPVTGNESSVSNTSICEGEEVSMSVCTNVSLQQFSEAYERTTQDDNPGKKFWGEFSKQMTLDFIPKKKQSSETLSETFEEKAEFVVSRCSPNKVTFSENTRERLVEVMNPEPPKDVGEELMDQCLLQKSDCSLERKRPPWKEEDQSCVSVVERKLEENTESIKAEIFVSHTLDSTLDDENEMNDTDGQEMNACSVVEDTTSGGKQLDQSASIENTFCKKTDEDRVESKETLKVPSERCDSGSVIDESIFDQQKTLENKGVDMETEIMANTCVGQTNLTYSSITETCTNSLEGNTAYPSSEEGGKVNDLSPLCLSKHPSLIADRSSDFNNYACSQIQSPHYVNKSDVGDNSEPVNDSTLPQQDTRKEEDTKLNDENRIAAVNHKWSIKSVLLDEDKVEFKHTDAHFSDLDLEALKNNLETNENSSVSSSHLELRQFSSAFGSQQETDSHAVEPEQLDSNIESKAKEDPVKQSLYPEDFAIERVLKKLCDQNRTAESLSPIGLERSSQSSRCQDEGNIELSASEMDSQPCSVDRNVIGFETPESAKENMPENLLKENETDSTEGSASIGAEELNLYVSDATVQKEEEETSSTRMKNVTGTQYDGSKALKERDTAISDPDSVSGSVVSDLDCKPDDQLDKTIETAGVKSVIDTEKLTDESLEEKNHSLCNEEYDINEVTMAGPENYSVGVVAGEFSHLPKNPTLREEKEENQTTARCDRVLLRCPHDSVEYPCILGSQREMETVKDYEKFGLEKRDACSSDELVGSADSNSIQAGKTLENPEPENNLFDGYVQELDMRRLAVFRAPRGVAEDSPVTERLSSLSVEKGEFCEKREINEQVPVQQESEESEPLKSLIKLYQPPGCADASADGDENVNTSESNFVNRIDSPNEANKDSQIKEANKNNYVRALKRHFSRHEYSGTSVSEDEQCSQKRKCSLGSASMQEDESDPPSPRVILFSIPTDLKECHDQFVSSGVRQFFRKYTTLQTAQHLDEMKQENSKSIAQLVREFFRKTSDSDNLVNENIKPDMFATPFESKVEKDADCKVVGEVNCGGSAGSNGSSLLLLSSTESHVNEKQSVKLISEPQSPPLDSRLGFTEPTAGSADSCTDVPEEDLVSKIPESPSADSLSEEEQFQSRVCSELNNRSVSVKSPLRSSHVESEESSKVKDLEYLFSDISNSSVESEHYPLTQNLSTSSCRTSNGLHERVCGDRGKADATDAQSGFSCSSSEDSFVYWSDEDTNVTSDLTATSSKSNQCVTAGVSPPHLEKGDYVESIVDKNYMSVMNQAERTLTGDKTPVTEDSSVPASCADSVIGASPTSRKIVLKVESYADQNEVPQYDGQSNSQLNEISSLQTKPACSPCKDLTPGATVDWNTNSSIREQIVSCERLGVNSQMQLKRKLSHEEHDNSGNRSSISPPPKMCLSVTANSSESADEEPAPSQKGNGTPDASELCSASHTSLADQVTQTPSESEVTCSLSHSPVPSSAVHVNSASPKAVSSNGSRCLQSSYSNRELDLSSSECHPLELGESAKVINSPHERTDKEEDVDEDGQQKQMRQTNFHDHMDGRVASRPCIPLGMGDASDLQTMNNPTILKHSSVPALGNVDSSNSALNSLTCEPAAFPSFKEDSLPWSQEVQMHSDASEDLSLDFKEYPSAHSRVLSASNSCGASETSVSSLPDNSFQPTTVAEMANAQIQYRVPSPCASEAWKYGHPASEHVYTSSEESSCHAEDFDEDAQEFPSTSAESLNAIGLLAETKNLASPFNAENSAPTASSSSTIVMESEVQKVWAVSERDIEFQLSQCQTVLDEISRTLCVVEGIDEAHMEEWREQIDKLQKDTKMPKTYIAVVGDTGAGKSSLLNALLDEEAVLPTSAMRACTAVVVEISKTSGESLYEADVEFLSKEEWDKDLKALLEDMKDKSGNLKKRCPDRKTEAGAAYSRVKAVYGMIAELPKLKEMKEVTQHLGTVKHISAEKAVDFRAQIEKFIDSRTDNLRDMKGGEFWPIVKCVKICVPGADVLKTGAVLVDLPGIRDSNAARDNAAKEYLKNCNAVWVVANITRAVDDKTAKEMLSANLRRQLLMDGQYGSLAFVCTKTDSFNITEIISDLDLRDEIQPLEISLEELESQRVRMEMEKETLYTQLQQEQQKQAAGADNLASFEKENDLRKNILDKEFRISNLQREKDKKIRAISLVCVQSRNRFSKQRIWVDFNNGLQEMKRKAAFAECGEDEEEEETEDEELTTSDTSDPGETESQHRKLQVFTVSSTEYLKLHGKLLRDGQPQVFHNDEDTEIPALKKFAIHTALQHSMVATEKVIRNVARVISQVVNYLTNQRAEDNSHQAQVQDIVQTCLSSLSTLLREAVEDSLHDIKYYFSVLILANLKKGAKKAKELCEDKVRSWGSPVNGYPCATYRAVCARHGVYSSVACGFVDFNEQLTEPISSAISLTWNEVFSCRLEESIKQFSKAILNKLRYFFKDLKKKLQEKGRNIEPVKDIQRHQLEAVQALLCNFLLDQMEYISKRQRGISRVLTPEIQKKMKPIYTVCNQLTGPGCFQKMKHLMQQYIHSQKEAVFNGATDTLQSQLDLLLGYIGGSFESVVQELTKSLAMQFEPVLKRVQKNDGIIPDLMTICAKVSKICKISCVDYVLPNLSQPESCSVPASPGKELSLKRELPEETDPPCFVGKCNVIRIGTVSLPHFNPIQISVQGISITMTDRTTMTLPFHSVYLCECCFHLYYLILHIAPEFAKDIYSRLGIQASNPNLGNQEALIILDKPQDPSSFHSLLEFLSARHGGTPWFQELNLQQGREKLESLGVYYTVQDVRDDDEEEKSEEVPPSSSSSDQLPIFTIAQQPALPGVNLYPYGRKRGGGEIHSQLEKKHKGKAVEQIPEGEPAVPCFPSSHVPGRLVVSAGKSMALHPWNTSREYASEWNTASLSKAPHSSHVIVKNERGLITFPSAAGVPHVRAKEGMWGKWPNPSGQEDNSADGDKMETSGNKRTAKDPWNPH